MRVNQNGDEVVEETVYGPYGTYVDDITNAMRDEAICLLCRQLKVKIVRTNATKHGTTEIVLQDDE